MKQLVALYNIQLICDDTYQVWKGYSVGKPWFDQS